MPSQSQAQITSDGTLSTEVTTSDKRNFNITGGSQAGGNLFHSFREFSIPEGGSAFFNNPSDVDNIISRVTGNSISNIDGLIRANPSANLFLINPKGIIFGQKAQLEIGGSFLASTANGLNFADGAFFSATDPQARPLLTISVPMGLEFGETAGIIVNQSQTIGSLVTPGGEIEAPLGLQVHPGKTLALVGGNIVLEGGNLTAPEGRIELGSVAGTAQVSIKPVEKGWSLGYEGVQYFQDIQLTKRTVDGTDIQSFVNTDGTGGGAIQLHGRQIAITNGSFVSGATLGAEQGESVEINATQSLDVSGKSSLVTQTVGTGKAGDIAIETTQLIVHDGGAIRAFSNGFGQAGHIIVDASTVEVSRKPNTSTPSIIEAQTFSPDENAGDAGTVQINTKKLMVNGGGQIANSTFGGGDGGTLTINASESVEVDGRSENGVFPSGLFAQSIGGNATGNAGLLEIKTKRLFVRDGARISVGAVFNSTGSVSTGQGGTLRITASDVVEVASTGTDKKGEGIPSTLLAESQGSGSAGNLTIETSRLNVRDGAEVSVSGTGEGAAGNLEINADSIRLDNQGSLRAETRASKGNITLQADDILLRRNSSITTDATQAASGGNITIDTVVLSVIENSRITADAVRGQGGNIQITTQGLFRSPDSKITAKSELGIDGEVKINILNDPRSGLVTLPAELVDISRLIAQGCSAGGGNVARAGKFVATGRGGLPPTPTEALRSDAVLADLGTPVQGEDRASAASPNLTNSQPSPIVEAQGWVIGSKGEVVLTAQAPTVTRIPWLTPTSCNAS